LAKSPKKSQQRYPKKKRKGTKKTPRNQAKNHQKMHQKIDQKMTKNHQKITKKLSKNAKKILGYYYTAQGYCRNAKTGGKVGRFPSQQAYEDFGDAVEEFIFFLLQDMFHMKQIRLIQSPENRLGPGRIFTSPDYLEKETLLFLIPGSGEKLPFFLFLFCGVFFCLFFFLNYINFIYFFGTNIIYFLNQKIIKNYKINFF